MQEKQGARHVGFALARSLPLRDASPMLVSLVCYMAMLSCPFPREDGTRENKSCGTCYRGTKLSSSLCGFSQCTGRFLFGLYCLGFPLCLRREAFLRRGLLACFGKVKSLLHVSPKPVSNS